MCSIDEGALREANLRQSCGQCACRKAEDHCPACNGCIDRVYDHPSRLTETLLGSPERYLGAPIAGRCGGNDVFQFVSCNCKRSLLLSASPVRKRTVLDVQRQCPVPLVGGVSSKGADAALHHSLIFVLA